MHTRPMFLSIVLLLACGGENMEQEEDDFLGSSDVIAEGEYAGADFRFSLTGDICERAGLVVLRSRDREAALTLHLTALPLEVGTYAMQWDASSGAAGFLSGPSLLGKRTEDGSTDITSVTQDEVRGRIDWVMGDYAPGVPRPPVGPGRTIARGTFRAVRVADEVECSQ